MRKQGPRIGRRADRRPVVLVAVVGTLLALAGCGGVGDADDLSTQQYVSSGQAICRAVQERLDVLGKKARRKPTSTAVGNSARKSAQAIGAGVDQLDLLPEPARLSSAADRFSRALLHQARVLDRLAAAVEAQDVRALRRMPSRLRKSEARAAVAARATGLTACGRRDLVLGSVGRSAAGRGSSRPAAAEIAGAEERDDTAARAARAAPDIEQNAADVARARSVLIRHSDLISVWGPEPEAKATVRPGIPRCPGLYMPDRSGVTITGTAEALFTNGADRIGSNAAFFRSHGDLKAYWRATVRPAYARCLARVLDADGGAGVRTRIVEARSLPFPVVGAERVAAYRTLVRKTRGSDQVDVHRTGRLHGIRSRHRQHADRRHQSCL